MNINSKTIAAVLIGFAIILLFILVLVKMDVDKQGALLCEAFHENELDMTQCPVHKSNVSWMILFAFGIGFVMLGVGAYLLFGQKDKAELAKKDFKPVDTSKLDEDEKKIYSLVKSKGGSVYQTDLIRETGFTKVKVTRILDKLESDEILERKRRGMTNIIVLK